MFIDIDIDIDTDRQIYLTRRKLQSAFGMDVTDSAYMSNESYDHMIATAWIPFLDAVPENGCMQVLSAGAVVVVVVGGQTKQT